MVLVKNTRKSYIYKKLRFLKIEKEINNDKRF